MLPRQSRLCTLAIYAAIAVPFAAPLLIFLMKRVGSDKTPFLHILPVPALLALALTFIALARVKRSNGKLVGEADCYFAITLCGIWLVGCWFLQLLGNDNR